MRQASALARLTARLFRWKTDARPEAPAIVNRFEVLCDRRLDPDREYGLDWRGPGAAIHRIQQKIAMLPRSYSASRGSALPCATRRPGPPKLAAPQCKIFREGDIAPLPAIRSSKPQGICIDVDGAVTSNGEKVGEWLAPEEVHERCTHRSGEQVQCCLPRYHGDVHLFKCAGDYCPGHTWIASNTPHPISCTLPPVDR